MIAKHQLELIARQVRAVTDKSICLCSTMYKGGGNNAVTYIVEAYEIRKKVPSSRIAPFKCK